MPRAAALFRQADLARVLRAANDCGKPCAVEVTRDGTIRIIPVIPVDHRADSRPPRPQVEPQGEPVL